MAFNAELDQIMISVRSFGEFWIIDHATTTAEAAGHKGGRRGEGGDLLYRWGNPISYRAGTKADQRLFGQHDAQWIPRGYLGAGHVLIFNNGNERPAGNYSSVDEIVLPVDAAGRLHPHAGRAVRAARVGLVVHGVEEGRAVLLHHVRRQSAPQRQHPHLRERRRHDLRGDV